MKAIIIEDELPSARRLERLLQGFEIEIITHLSSIKTSISWFKKNLQPDLIFLDVQLSDGLCFEIFKEIQIKSKIIFTTAYSNYSIQAFDYNSISYLLKPINLEKLNEAIAKAKHIHQKEADLERFKDLISNYKTEIYKESFTVKIGKKIKIIKIDVIDCFYSFENTTYLKTENQSYPISDSLTSLDNDLNPDIFFRVNRTFIIKKTIIKDIIKHAGSRLKITPKTSKSSDIIVSRDRVKDFKNWID